MGVINKNPLIKWSGSKRKQAPQIVDNFPTNIDTYYEPFLGGGSVLHELLNRVYEGEIKVKKIVCSDLNKDLILIWNIFKKDSNKLFKYYCEHRQNLFERSGMPSEDVEMTPEYVKAAQTYYYEERDRFNHMQDKEERGLLFFWITKTCFNGLIRYNPKGDFNVPFHVGGRLGQTPEKLEQTIDAWKEVMQGIDIEFRHDSYENVIKDAKEGDVVYMDPPYANFKGMYFINGFSQEKMFDEMRKMNEKNVTWFLSYDGKTGDDDRTENIPKELYKSHTYVNSGASNFKKLKSKTVGTSATDIVYDSLYTNK